ncbi:phage terminase large subunit [Thalassobacillus sp. CUG 92003]|uniref:phage terminase large subunit n=1 Tax=Thalassobacillus sp. CUG 92003 TaxID=2736641 RepID=UPI00351A0223
MVTIAWVDQRWLYDEERKEMLALYTELIETYEVEYGADPSDWPPEAQENFLVWSKLERVERCKDDQLEFAIEYFSESRNPGNEGNWDGFDIEDKSEAPGFHEEIAGIMNEVSTEKVNAKVAVAAPRSHAKSTYLSKNFPVHQVVYRLRKYIIIISETPNVSKGNMEWIRNQMKFNEKLRADFGPLLSPKDQSNIQDNSESFIAWHLDSTGEKRRQLSLVEAASTGQALRGRNWNGSRPSLIVMDDLEDARPGGNASTPEQRAKLKDWFSQTVMPLGDPKGKKTAFVYMGTTVHWEALLMQVLHHRSDFESRIYKAIIEHPVRTDLWEQCREIYIDRDNKNRKQDAEQFYHENEDEMLKGVKVLWPEVKPILELMEWKWDNGSKAFNTEYMNNPVDEESMIFNPEHFTYWDEHQTKSDFTHAGYLFSMGIDFALGKERGDYSAIAINAHHREKDIDNVIDTYGERVLPDKFIDDIVEKVLEYQPDIIAAEAQAAQEFFVETLKTRLTAEGYPAHTRVKKVHQRSRKELRIETMLPRIESGAIRFSRKHHLMLEQFERYGQGAHDDVIDAVEMAVSASKANDAVVRMSRKRMR